MEMTSDQETLDAIRQAIEESGLADVVADRAACIREYVDGEAGYLALALVGAEIAALPAAQPSAEAQP